jgi:hypothetical protein
VISSWPSLVMQRWWLVLGACSLLLRILESVTR